MTNEDFQNIGFNEAAAKHATGIDLPAYFEGRDNKGQIAPYIAPPEKPVNLAPVGIAVAKLAGIAGGLVIAWKTVSVGIATIFAFIEANAGIAVAVVVGGVALLGVSASRSSGSSSGGGYSGGGQRGGNCGCRGTTIIQNNNFGGGSANQTNQ